MKIRRKSLGILTLTINTAGEDQECQNESNNHLDSRDDSRNDWKYDGECKSERPPKSSKTETKVAVFERDKQIEMRCIERKLFRERFDPRALSQL
uniref:Uncharacterized protein n=1 Tax=Vespula pensylvanica TaxID=30213 RepID=A0A834UFM7_VESPE|nr:hypothetical protein H0235_004008 [Vespula pensylvanica]